LPVEIRPTLVILESSLSFLSVAVMNRYRRPHHPQRQHPDPLKKLAESTMKV
jgi:hypothetical protein